MGMLRHILPKLLLGVFLTGGVLHAQEEKLERARKLFMEKQFEAARLAIDSVVLHPQTSADFLSWTTRAYIYNEVFKRSNEKMWLKSPLRDTIINCLKTSNKLEPDTVYINNNRKMYRTLSYGMFNLAKALYQDSLNYERSQVAYNNFKTLYLNFDAKETFKAKDLEYYLAVGSFYSSIFNQNMKNFKAMDVAKVTLMKALDIQPDQPNALMNMGLMYFNQAVMLVKELEGGEDFEKIDEIQTSMVKLAKQAEGFILKVYTNDPKNTKAMRALFQIYRMLSDIEKSDDFKKKLKENGVDVDKEAQEAEQQNKSETGK